MKEELRGEGGSDVFSSTRHVNPNAVRARFHEHFNFMPRLLYVHTYGKIFQLLGLRSDQTTEQLRNVNSYLRLNMYE